MEPRRRAATPDTETPAPALPEVLDAALDRLAAALDRLRAVAQRQADAMAPSTTADAGLAFLQGDDRERLAAERDAAVSRAEALREAHAAALERLDRAESSIETVMRELAERTGDEPAPEEAP